MLPAVFGENLFDSMFDDAFSLVPVWNHRNPLYGKHAKNLMKTDVRETEGGYELDMDLPGFKKEEVEITVVKDGPKKLAARRKIMSKLYDLQEIKGFNESKSAYKARTEEIAHPLVEKLFNEIAPKYAQRNDEKNCAGGYTRIMTLGERRGDAAEVAIIELV